MPVDPTEIEIVNGARAWPETQIAFGGVLDQTRGRLDLAIGWYGTDVDENEGAFAFVRANTPAEDLVGDVVRVDYDKRSIFIYVIGTTNRIPTDMALARRAYMALALLSDPQIDVTAQPVITQ